jgi:hypothetical protein
MPGCARGIRPLSFQESSSPVKGVIHTVVIMHGRAGVAGPPVEVGDGDAPALPHPHALVGLVGPAQPVHIGGR